MKNTIQKNDFRQRFGDLGENLAAHYLVACGYRILKLHFRVRIGEVDLIAQKGRTLVFVEVKARASPMFGDAVEAVNFQKIHRLIAVAEAYLSRYNWKGEFRLDVIGLEFSSSRFGDERKLISLEHLCDVTHGTQRSEL
ncbi:MAG: YraN family protein [Candidatus Gracilibacteria bacterium]